MFADLAWYERKIAAALFATPPDSSYSEVNISLLTINISTVLYHEGHKVLFLSVPLSYICLSVPIYPYAMCCGENIVTLL